MDNPFEDSNNNKILGKKKEESSGESLERNRNLGIIAHIDSGKTTLTESLLFLCKEIHKVGNIKEGSTSTDFLPLERQRGITIQSACVNVKWGYSHFRKKDSNSYKFNIIDSPGHIDFNAEVERALRVLDGAILVMDGKKGPEAQTEAVFAQATKYKIPRLIFVNKLDNVESEKKFYDCLEGVKERLRANALPINIPMGAGKELKGVIDLIEEKAFFFTFGDKEENYRVEEIPAAFKAQADKWRAHLINTVIGYDQAIAERYLENEQITPTELRRLVRKAALTCDYFPTLCGSAFKHIGVSLILDAIIDFLPSVYDRREFLVYRKGEEEKASLMNFDDPSIKYLALVFKVVIDEFNSTIVFIRVYSGEIRSNSYIYNVSKDKEERVSNLILMNADRETKVSVVRAGEIVAIKNLKYATTGDTFSSDKKVFLERIVTEEAVVSQAIILNSSKDVDKLKEALEKMHRQDPSFGFSVDNETGQIIMKGRGVLHLEVAEHTLINRYNIPLTTEPPKISYRETIKNTFETWGELKSQHGGHGRFARIFLRFEPNPGKGFEFVNAVRGQEITERYAESVKAGLEEVMASGLLLGYPMQDIKFTLLDGKSHKVDTAPEDFKDAAKITCRVNSDKLGLVMLEPIVNVALFIPKAYMGAAIASLSSYRAVIEAMEDEDEDTFKITAKASLSKMIGYSAILRNFTEGRGRYIMAFSHFQEMNRDEIQKMISLHKAAAGA